jgi:hypothetical protein
MRKLQISTHAPAAQITVAVLGGGVTTLYYTYPHSVAPR